MVEVSSWGRLSHADHEMRMLAGRDEAPRQLPSHGAAIAYGMGRSYGDVCLNPDGLLWNTTGRDRFIRFDAVTGRLTCEAGVLLRDIQRTLLPQGWMLPVTPGTQLVTVGGAIANDVHGKNHGRFGSFGDHVTAITLVRTDGTVIECGPEREAGWFTATVGGLGLTGVIVEAEIRLKRVASAWLDTETIPYENLDEFFALADASQDDWEHTVSWVDCVGGGGQRGIFSRANSAVAGTAAPEHEGGLGLSVPFTPPISLINRASLRPFNAAYFHLGKRRAGRRTVHYEPFFYPLDHVGHWNRAYGPRGFFQYQAVVPRLGGQAAIGAMLAKISASGFGSFLAVLKTFGDRDALGLLSFPRPGVTLALDFPNQGAATLKLFDALDAIVRDAGGRIYPAKDARMPRAMFEAGYPRLGEFLTYRDPGLSSAMSRRLLGS